MKKITIIGLLIISVVFILTFVNSKWTVPRSGFRYRYKPSYHFKRHRSRQISRRQVAYPTVGSLKNNEGFRLKLVGARHSKRGSPIQISSSTRVIGPNECGSDRCCHGWKRDLATQLCTVAVCVPKCENNGICHKPNRCHCRSHFFGTKCQHAPRSVFTNRRGIRQTLVRSRYLTSRHDFPTENPELKSVKRCSSTCFNGGTCTTNGPCVCPSGYSGVRCEKVAVTRGILSEIPPGLASSFSDVKRLQVSLELCRSVCVHGDCQIKEIAICQCHVGYRGPTCKTPMFATARSSRLKSFRNTARISGSVDTENSDSPLSPRKAFEAQQMRLLQSSLEQKCYKSSGLYLCKRAFKIPMTYEACCVSGLGDSWGDNCTTCSGASERRLAAPKTTMVKMCAPGYRLTDNLCRDVNECTIKPNLCQQGTCVNTRGSFICQCLPGFQSDASKTRCNRIVPKVDIKESPHGFVKCYIAINHDGTCDVNAVVSLKGTKATCCCSIGTAWGEFCDKCPDINSDEGRLLCPSVSKKDSFSLKANLRGHRNLMSQNIHDIISVVNKQKKIVNTESTTTETLLTTKNALPNQTNAITSNQTHIMPILPTTEDIATSISTNNDEVTTETVGNVVVTTTDRDLTTNVNVKESPTTTKYDNNTNNLKTTQPVTTNEASPTTVIASWTTGTQILPRTTQTNSEVSGNADKVTTEVNSRSPTTSNNMLNIASDKPPVISQITTTAYVGTTNQIETSEISTTRISQTLTDADNAKNLDLENTATGLVATTNSLYLPTENSADVTTADQHTTSVKATTDGIKSSTLPTAPAQSTSTLWYDIEVIPREVLYQNQPSNNKESLENDYANIFPTRLSLASQESTKPESNEAEEFERINYYDIEDDSYDVNEIIPIIPSGNVKSTTTTKKHVISLKFEKENVEIPKLIKISSEITPSNNELNVNEFKQHHDSFLEPYQKESVPTESTTTAQTTIIEAVDYCQPVNPCYNGGICGNLLNGFSCKCMRGFAGKNCEIDFNECMSSPCLNGVCLDQADGFECKCNVGFKGEFCQTDVNECTLTTNICGGEALCINTIGSYTCVMPATCSAGYVMGEDGRTCKDINECLNGTLCDGGTCINDDGSYHCACNTGYMSKDSGRVCQDLNECETVECNRPAVCENLPGTYRCNCPNPNMVYDFNMQMCKFNPDMAQNGLNSNQPVVPNKACFSSPLSCTSQIAENSTQAECCCSLGMSWGDCGSRAICPRYGSADYKAMCFHGRGLVADVTTLQMKDIDECAVFGSESICRNGNCHNSFGAYQCVCHRGFFYNSRRGACDDINECLMKNVCYKGRCRNVIGSYKCKCGPGHVLKYRGFSSTCIRAFRKPSRVKTTKLTPVSPTTSAFRDTCYTEIINHYMCGVKLNRLHSYKSCCCGNGVAWGSSCSRCPDRDSRDYAFLCSRKRKLKSRPPFVQVSENTPTLPTLGSFHEHECGLESGCENGKCLRTVNGFTCDCHVGYRLDQDTIACEDVDECAELGQLSALCFGGDCVNTAGSFICRCHDGFKQSFADPTVCLPETEEIDTTTDLLDRN